MSAALEEFCGSVFWNDSYLSRPDADLPVCFQQTVLVWVPLGFFWIFAPWQVLPICKSKAKKSSLTILYIIKQVLTALLVLAAVAELALTSVDDAEQGGVPAVLYTNPSLYIATWEPISDLPRFILFFISYGLQLLLFFVSGFSDIAPETKEIGKKNPEVTASFLSSITFEWYSSIVFKGYRKPLEIEDVWELKDKDKTKALYTAFEKNMKTEMKKARADLEKRERKKRRRQGDPDLVNSMSKAQSQDILVLEEKQPKKKKKKGDKEDSGPPKDYPRGWLLSTLAKTFKQNLLLAVAFKVVHDALVFVSPQLLKLLIAFVSDEDAFAWQGYLYAILLFLTALVQSICLQQHFSLCFQLGINVRASLIAAIYKKVCMVLSSSLLAFSKLGCG
ncbi:hypothetical protein TURU_130717 [Turdus rufiventris]|nr:hypothetical protein TURU_130717 [Turdus rufiventris]